MLDGDSGRVLLEKDGDVKRPMASTTKIMTCILALEHMKSEQEIVTASAEAASRQRSGWESGKDRRFICETFSIP